jgi:cell division septum initiation protein DivIVA
VLPVSDPNAATMAQRIMQYQAAMQLSQTAPNMYDLPELHRQMLGVLGINDVDNIVPDKDDIKAVDPVTAVQNLINGKPVKAFINQDHDAHIEVIASVQQNQEIMQTVEKSPNAAGILAAASAYVNDHLTMKYREDIEKELGVELPPMDEPLPADIEKRISSLVAEAAQRVLGTSQQRAEKLRVQEMQKDPLIQAKEKEVAIKEQEALRRAEEGEKRLQLDAAKAANRDAIERERIKSQTQIAGAQIGSKAASELLKADQLADKKATDDFLKGVDLAKDLLEDS